MTADTTGEVHARTNRLACLPHLVRVRNPSRIDSGSRGPHAAPNHFCQFMQHAEVLRFLHAPTAADDEVLTEEKRDEDFDRAVSDFYRDADVQLTCKNHPDLEATGQCPEVESTWLT